MLKTPLVLRRRRERAGGPQWARALALTVMAVLGLVLGLAAVAGALLSSEVTAGLPAVDGYESRFGSPVAPQFPATRLYDRTGQVLIYEALNPAAVDRRWVNIAAASPDRLPVFGQATLAIQDPGFWTHPGYDWRAMLASIMGVPSPQTLTEQLVAHTLLPLEDASLPDRVRRLRAVVLAAELTRRYSKSLLLEWYLNTADYGNDAYGIDAAALTYFGKHAGDLSLAEAALLAGIPLHPSTNPAQAPEQAEALKNEVLEAMRRSGLVTADQLERARAERVALKPLQTPAGGDGWDYGRYAWNALREAWGADYSRWGGLRIITAEDHDLQLQAECVAQTHLQRLQGANPGLVVSAADGTPCVAAGLLPALRPSDAGVHHHVGSIAVMILDPQTGEVLSVVGSPDAKHTAVSALYPFTYLAAFSRGYGPGTMVLDLPPDGEDVTSGDFRGPVRMRTALAAGLDTAAQRTFALTGSQNVALIAREMGVELPDDLSSQPNGRGGNRAEVSLASLTTALGVLSNEGRWVGEENSEGRIAPISILRVEDTQGTLLRAASPTTSAVVSAPLAYLVNDVLSDETALREAFGAADVLDIGRPAAVVLDAQPGGADFWGLGYTRERSVGVWLGESDRERPTGVHELNGAAPVWHALLQYATRDLPAQNWTMPAGVTELQVCDPSGLLPTQYCPRVVREVFIQGTEPVNYDTLYQPLRVNRETGKLATLFTPIDLVEERVYLVPPPGAAVWAEATGIEKPPTEYDTVLAGESGSSVVNITRPEMFKYVRGKVTLRGAADPKDFKYYRLQYGQGLNPTRWVQIGADSQKAVASGSLGEWDTDGLEGLYSVQLVVVYGDGQVSTDAVQVTVDNKAPQVSLVLPEPGTQTVPVDGLLVIEAQVTDELGVARVELLVDGKAVGSVSSAPYSLRWKADAGQHTITARATDYAGNTGQSDAIRVVVVVQGG
jgi:membrane peptidoglycan carboxypeptidase